MIANEEEIKITDGALMLISRLATGAMRDALSMLELFYKADHEITEEEATERLGVVGRAVVFALLDAVCTNDTSAALSVISEAYNNSKDLGVLCSELSDTLRDIIVTKYVKDPSKLIDATQADIERLKGFASKLSDEKLMYCSELCEDIQARLSRAVFSRRTIIETGVIKMCEEKLSFDTATLLTRISALEEKMAMMASGVQMARPAVATSPKPEEKQAEAAFDSSFPEAPMPTDSDIPFDMPFGGPYVEDTKKEVSPKPITPKPLSPRPLVKPNTPADTSSPERKPFMAYAELIEEIASCDKIAASMLEGGRGYICEGNVCEFEVTNPIAPMLLKQGDKAACLDAALTKLLGYCPNVKIKFVAGAIEQQRTDLSSLQ
jgi:DNA polymerase-3 subunit gamma/tau